MAAFTDNITSFLQRPIITLDGYKITVLTVVIVAVIYLVWRKARR